MFVRWLNERFYDLATPYYAVRWLADALRREPIPAAARDCKDFAEWVRLTVQRREAGYPLLQDEETLHIHSARFTVKQCYGELDSQRYRSYDNRLNAPPESSTIAVRLDPKHNAITYYNSAPYFHSDPEWIRITMGRKPWAADVYCFDERS